MPRKKTFQEVKALFIANGYELLETEYIGANVKMRYRCPLHPDLELSIKYNHLKNGHGCPECGIEKAIKKNKGDNHRNWNGGQTTLEKYLRKQTDRWKRRLLKEYGYRCVITGERRFDLDTHHLKPFHQICEEIFKELNLPTYETIGEYTKEELESISAKIREKHNDAIGVPIKKEMHQLFHEMYGKKNTRPENLLEFKLLYLRGKLDDIKKSS
jgi:hypothetical protein